MPQHSQRSDTQRGAGGTIAIVITKDQDTGAFLQMRRQQRCRLLQMGDLLWLDQGRQGIVDLGQRVEPARAINPLQYRMEIAALILQIRVTTTLLEL